MDYKELINEDKEIVLEAFLNSDAFLLGKYISEAAISNKYPVAVKIIKNNETVFQFVNDGASKNNIHWIEKKMNVVKRFEKSSALIAYKLKSEKLTFEKKYGDSREYAAAPGAVPIKVKNVGMVGIIAVSGLVSEQDHELAVSGLNHLLSVQRGEIK